MENPTSIKYLRSTSKKPLKNKYVFIKILQFYNKFYQNHYFKQNKQISNSKL